MLIRRGLTEKGFDIRLEARLKNADLVGAREVLGLSSKQVAEQLEIPYQAYLSYESMRNYPSDQRRKAICDFFREKGVFLFEDDVFPEELRDIRPRKYVVEKTVEPSQLLSLSRTDHNLLPYVEEEASKVIEQQELERDIDIALSHLPFRQAEIIRRLYGIGGIREHTAAELAEEYGMCAERIRQIKERALQSLRYHRKKGGSRLLSKEMLLFEEHR